MADQDQYEVVVGFGVARNRAHGLAQLGRGGLLPAQGVNMADSLEALKTLIEILCRRSEALLVVGLAAQAGDDDVVRRRARVQR